MQVHGQVFGLPHGAGGARRDVGGPFFWAAVGVLVASPDDTVVGAPAACGQCGAGLADAPVTGVQKLQEFDITPPPPPRVTEYQVQARACGRCGTVTAGQPPRGSLAGRNTDRR